MLNCGLKKANFPESIFMVPTGMRSEFQDRQARSNALIFYQYNSVKCFPILLK